MMIDKSHESCRCVLRTISANYDALLNDEKIPEGYCGRCSECGALGHTRFHPHSQYTNAWCDRCWQAALNDSSTVLKNAGLIALMIGFAGVTVLAVLG